MKNRRAGFLLDVPLDFRSLATAVEDAVQCIESKHPSLVFACANPHSLVIAQTDFEFKLALRNANLVVADGIGIKLMSRLAGVQSGPRITGHDYFHSLLNALQQRGQGRVFFFGSSQRVLDLIAERFRIDFPALTLCGVHSPPFGSWSPEENIRMVRIINGACPDVLWVGMTAPKQEKWVEENRLNLQVPVIGSIGAVFDFYAGTHPRSPEWVCEIGLEWAYRFMKEPRRMWKRNVISAPKFVALVIWRHLLAFAK